MNSSMLARVPGPADFEAIEATISAYGTGRDAGDRGDDRDRRLAAAGDHVDVGGVEVLVEVDRRHDERADRRRGQVDQPLAVAARAARRWRRAPWPRWRRRRCRSRRSRAARSARRRPRAVVGDAEALRRGPGRRTSGSMPTMAPISRVLGEPQHLDHQVGADVAGADDRDLGLALTAPPRRSCEKRAVTEPRPRDRRRSTRVAGRHGDHRARARRRARPGRRAAASP